METWKKCVTSTSTDASTDGIPWWRGGVILHRHQTLTFNGKRVFLLIYLRVRSQSLHVVQLIDVRKYLRTVCVHLHIRVPGWGGRRSWDIKDDALLQCLLAQGLSLCERSWITNMPTQITSGTNWKMLPLEEVSSSALSHSSIVQQPWTRERSISQREGDEN